jgi:hypothetical protein
MSAAGGGKFARFKKWIGVAAALLSFGTAVYELLHAEAELRERRRIVAEQLATGHEHQTAGDYRAAWKSFETASTTAEADGLFAKLLGGLSAERQRVRAAQEDLAMEWLRASRITKGETFAELSNTVVNVLASGAAAASGVRKADLLAHQGWAYFYKYRSGDLNVMPDVAYREAVASDAKNPYANVFWGHWILWNHGSMREAEERFAAALSTDRARAEVRRFQLAAFSRSQDEYEAAWLGAVNDMREHGEPVSAAIWHELWGRYYFMLNNASLRRTMFAAVPPGKQLALQSDLLQSGDLNPAQRLVTKAVTALTLEAASKKDEAAAAWRELLAEAARDPDSTLAMRARSEIKRLSGSARQRP